MHTRHVNKQECLVWRADRSCLKATNTHWHMHCILQSAALQPKSKDTMLWLLAVLHSKGWKDLFGMFIGQNGVTCHKPVQDENDKSR